jgi:hypothetical protein
MVRIAHFYAMYLFVFDMTRECKCFHQQGCQNQNFVMQFDDFRFKFSGQII